MAQIMVATRDMSREEWLAWRRKGIGGSDVAAIAGLSRWRSPVAVWLEKTGQVEGPEDNEAMYWGRVLEDVVADEFCRRTGKKLRRRNAMLQHPKYQWMLANVDRLVVGERAGFEAKTTSEWHRQEWDDERVPDEYLLQCQHYMAVTGFERWYIAVLIGGHKFLWQAVERDEEIIQYLIKIESDFWHLVETKQPPAMDGSEASAEVLKRLYPTAEEDKEILLPAEAEALIAEYEAAAEDEKIASERKEAAANKLKALLGDAEAGRIGDRLVTWKNVTTSRLDTKMLKAHHPEVYAQFCKSSTYRKFQIK